MVKRKATFNPEIIHLIVNEYCKGRSCRVISGKLFDIYNIEVNRCTVSNWLNKFKQYVDLDAIREKDVVDFETSCIIATKFKNHFHKHKQRDGNEKFVGKQPLLFQILKNRIGDLN